MPRFEVFEDQRGEWRWRLRGGNSRILCQSEGYSTARDARRGATAASPRCGDRGEAGDDLREARSMSEVIIRDYSGGFDGRRWLEAMAIKASVPEFSGLIADILGYVWRGIYHLPLRTLTSAHWKERMVEIVIGEGLATFDSSKLTELVILCHAACVRFEVSGAGSRYLRLQFWPRARTGSAATRHPTLRQAVHQLETGLGVRPKGDEAAA